MGPEIKILIGVLFVIVLVVVNVIRAQETAKQPTRRPPRPFNNEAGEPSSASRESSDTDVQRFLNEIDRMRARQAQQQRQQQQQRRQQEQQQRQRREEPPEVILTPAPPQAQPTQRPRQPAPPQPQPPRPAQTRRPAPPAPPVRPEKPPLLGGELIELRPANLKEIEKGSLFQGVPHSKHEIATTARVARLAKMSGDKKKVTKAAALLKKLLKTGEGVTVAVVMREILERPESAKRPLGGGA